MKYVMMGIVRVYQKVISPIKPPCCRFSPTCSAYAFEAFSKRGFFIGLALTVYRLLRCNPFSKGGYDPVPEHGFRNKKPKDTGNSEICDRKNETNTNTETEKDN